MITVCSIFRNSETYLDRYFAQIDALRKHVKVRLVGTWGDSTDDTAALLHKHGGIEIEAFHHGGPNFGSVDNPARWDQIARVVCRTLDRVGDPGDALVWVESDLIWDPDTILRLLDDLARVPAAAPQVLADGSDRWYDTWGYRQGGRLFSGFPPYWTDPADPETGLVKIDSSGSCFATRGDEWQTWSGHWPYTAGGDLWLDPALTVRHP